MLQVPSCWLDHLPSVATLPWFGSMAGSSWWCHRLWHSLSLLWLCPVVTFTPHTLLPTCGYSERLNLFYPRKVPSWGWSEPQNCSGSGLLYLLGTESHPLILICSCTWNVHFILGCALSWLVPLCTWWVVRAVTGSLSGQRLTTGRDWLHICQEADSKPKSKSIWSKGDIKGAWSPEILQKDVWFSLVIPCFQMFKQIQCIIWSNDKNIYRREWW